METVFIGGRAIALAGMVGSDLVFNSIRATSTTIISSVSYLCSPDSRGEQIKSVLSRLDLTNRINIITAFISELNGDHQPESVKLSLVGVENILQEIDQELKKIQQILLDHQSRWFSGWRSLDYADNLNNLQRQSDILNTRIDLLIRLLQVDPKRFIEARSSLVM